MQNYLKLIVSHVLRTDVMFFHFDDSNAESAQKALDDARACRKKFDAFEPRLCVFAARGFGKMRGVPEIGQSSNVKAKAARKPISAANNGLIGMPRPVKVAV
jgi:hypothetical protein